MPSSLHAVARDPSEECRTRIADQLPIQVEGRVEVVVGRRGKTRRDAARRHGKFRAGRGVGADEPEPYFFLVVHLVIHSRCKIAKFRVNRQYFLHLPPEIPVLWNVPKVFSTRPCRRRLSGWRRSSHCCCSAWATLRSRCCPTVGVSRRCFSVPWRCSPGAVSALSWPELRTVFFLSLFRAATSLSLVIAYQHIASGVASTIHFMYPLAVALAMMCFFREKGSVWVFAAIGMSIVGAVLLSLGNVDFTWGIPRWAWSRPPFRSSLTAVISSACARAVPWGSTPRC